MIELLLSALGGVLVIAGALVKYIVATHDRKLTEMRADCKKAAEEVQANLDKNSRRLEGLEVRVDQEIKSLDRDIKNVGERLGTQIQALTEKLFEKIDDNRKEMSEQLQAINRRLDSALTRVPKD